MAQKVQQAPTIFSGSYIPSDATTTYDADKPSRLSESTEDIRNGLLSRNLYGEFNQYPLAQNDAQRVVESINSIINIILPFRSYDLKNTVYGRLITNPTPLTEIGLIMLGKQFTMNFASHVAQQTFQVFKPSNLFDGKKDTKLFEFGKQFKITKEEDIGTFTKFFELLTSKYPRRNFELTSLDAKDRNDVFIRNTGGGQIDMLYKNISRNVYREDNKILQDKTEEVTGEGYPSKVTVLMNNNIKFFNFDNIKFYPYTDLWYKTNNVTGLIDDADTGVYNGYGHLVGGDTIYEYAPNKDYVDDNFGVANKTIPKERIGDISEFRNDNIDNKIVWGRDDVSKYSNERLHILRGLENDDIKDSYYSMEFKHNVRTGLLHYTKNLLNATEGRMVDITRKAFEIDPKNNIHGFNGSGLWVRNDTKYSNASGAPKTGVRQHSILDPYNKFTKTIRFNGNNVYGGNKDSVIYDSVMPRIHPTLDLNKKTVNNKSLMFAIENLGVRTTKDTDKMIAYDELGGYLPYEEAGPFNGRIMWFPPYNIDFNETSTAKYQSTVMVGRNEPIYNYINSERSANLNFWLIIDYPPQLRNYLKTLNKEDRYKEIVDFFAFGGDPEVTDITISDNSDEQIRRKEERVKEIKGEIEEISEPTIIEPIEIRISFPNDQPTSGQINTIFDEMYTAGYEVDDGLIGNDSTFYGMNKDIFANIGRAGSVVSFLFNPYRVLPTWNSGGESQYTTTIDNNLNTSLRQVFDDKENWGYYDIYITAGSSKLYLAGNEQEYNQALSDRRTQATKHLIQERIKVLYPESTAAERLKIKYVLSGKGSDGVSVENLSVSQSIEGISAKSTKEERYAIVTIKKNSINFPRKEVKLSSEQESEINQLNQEIEDIKTQRIKQKSLQEMKLLNERRLINAEGSDEIIGGNDAILDKGKAFTENYYYPAYHSQTPEEFHRRLTFLQQCLRQGPAQREDSISEDGIVRAKNSVFGRQPICVLRIADFFYTKVVIESINIDYSETTWDMNPEGFGMQPMIAKITMQMKLIGGQSLKGPVDALQNAISYNYYANSTFTDKGLYARPSEQANIQDTYLNGIDGESGILGSERQTLLDKINNENKNETE